MDRRSGLRALCGVARARARGAPTLGARAQRALWRLRSADPSAAADRQARTDIVLIKVSEQKDITNVEDNLSISWPWPRALFGYIATYAKRAGARVITYDWLFQERGRFSVGDAEELATALHGGSGQHGDRPRP
ncbi:MAG: CHASE2 domain-containing protein [Myxococcales bacterium]|nr:CHASE2 domain-containing protein [Myxococcales bacterium]